MSVSNDAPTIPAGTWSIDPVHSTVGFAVKHMAVATFRGRFEDFDVTLAVAERREPRLVGTVKVDDRGQGREPRRTPQQRGVLRHRALPRAALRVHRDPRRGRRARGRGRPHRQGRRTRRVEGRGARRRAHEDIDGNLSSASR